MMECWASAFAPRVVAYRAEHGQDDLPDIAVVVQVMVDPPRRPAWRSPPTRSGAGATASCWRPRWGQGEVVVSGRAEPDTYVARRRRAPAAATCTGAPRRQKIVAAPGGGDRLLPRRRGGGRPGAEPRGGREIAALGLRVQAHFGMPAGRGMGADRRPPVSLVQTRPITTLAAAAARPRRRTPGQSGAPLLHGLAASPGRATGRVRVLHSPSEGVRLVDGEVLVAPMTNPDWMPAVRRAAALVTDTGGVTCHAAIVAPRTGRAGRRRHPLGHPDARRRPGGHGRRGHRPVLAGRRARRRPRRRGADRAAAPRRRAAAAGDRSAPRLYVNLADAARPPRVAALPRRRRRSAARGVHADPRRCGGATPSA